MDEWELELFDILEDVTEFMNDGGSRTCSQLAEKYGMRPCSEGGRTCIECGARFVTMAAKRIQEVASNG